MTMPAKRKLVQYEDDEDDDDGASVHDTGKPIQQQSTTSLEPVAKRLRTIAHDIISTLSDELLIRILSFLDEKTLLGTSPVDRKSVV